MIRVFSHYVSAGVALLVVAEVLMLMFAAYTGMAFHSAFSGEVLFPDFLNSQVLLFAFAMLFVMAGLGVYQVDFHGNANATQLRILAALALGYFGNMAFVSLFGNAPVLDLNQMALAILIAALGSSLLRFGFYRVAKKAKFKRRVLVLGTGSRVGRFAEMARDSNRHNVVGYVGMETPDPHMKLLRVLPMGEDETIYSLACKHRIDEIVVAVRDRRNGGLPVQDLLKCKLQGIKVTNLPTFLEREYQVVMLDSINPSWMVFGEGFNQRWVRSLIKRVFDLVASTILLVVTLPVMLIAAICIILEDGMPIFYRQERVGQHGRIFTIFKFRSMRNDAEKDGKPRWAATNDDRITRTGRILRKLRIDELPQIINVFKGDMSFVGPRPERPFFVNQLAEQIPYFQARHSVKPGITGWAQVRYAYGATIDDAVEKLQYDLYYVKNHGLFLDLITLIATVEVVICGKGAR